MRRYGEKGSTLIMITWLLLLIAVVASFLLYRAELEWAVTLNLERDRQVRELARAILAQQLGLLIADDNDYDAPQEPWFHHTGFFAFQRNGYQVTVTVEDEGSKPKLNLLSKKGLQKLLGDDLSPDPILDWIDSDSEPKEQGAEAPYYQSLNPPYKPRNGFVASLREILQMKDGAACYQKLASEVTVYGRYNPNTLSADQFGELLLAYGFERNWVASVQDRFTEYRQEFRFTTLEDFLKLTGVTLATCDQLQPILQFDGSCNLNLVNRSGLAALLSEAGQKPEWAARIGRDRQEKPFTTLDAIKTYFYSQNAKFKAEDYFCVNSSIFRYRIWLVKNRRTFYLETVQQRVAGNLKRKWRVKTLAWLELQNDAAPEIAKKQESEEQDHAPQSTGR